MIHLNFQSACTYKGYVSHDVEEAHNHDTEYDRSSEGSSFIIAGALFNLFQYLDQPLAAIL